MESLESEEISAPVDGASFSDINETLEEPTVFFRDGISLGQLEKGAEFEIDPLQSSLSSDDDDDDNHSFEDDYCDSLKAEFSELCTTKEVPDEHLEPTTFEELSKKMQPITDDKLILKLEITPGSGAVIPLKSLVMMHYTACLEKKQQPFDSTRLRSIPFKFLLGDGRVIPGLDIAVSTMKKGEISQFLVRSEYAYGRMGCPPRIPPDATILYEVEILSFVESSAAIEFEEMTPEEQKKASFDKVLSVCKAEHQIGNDFFKKKQYQQAVNKYRKAAKLLEDISVNNDQDDDKRQGFLLKLYLNMSLCHLNKMDANRAIRSARLALEIDKNNTKALFRFGKARMLEKDFVAARNYFVRAKQNEPYNVEITEALLKLEEQQQQHLLIEKEYCAKMFQDHKRKIDEQQQNSDINAVSKEFADCIKNYLEDFKQQPDQEYSFHSSFSESEIDVIKSIAKSFGFNCVEKIFQNKKIFKVVK